jgi:ABC-type amino acid transport substrate-binding protein/putative hemolysin
MIHNRFSIWLVVLAVLVLAACAPAPTPPPTATPQPTFTPQPPIAEDDWARIRSAGVLQVASALDNPPFDMYNARFSPDGFDIALITEMARRLGLEVEVSDFAFEGLLDALNLKQADAVIAAMAITDTRLAQAAFTPAYYLGEDGILAAPDSPIASVTSVDDLTSRRVGVVRGTVYEAWLRQNLIQTGQMPTANLQTYTKPEDAVASLQRGLVDLVILDREVALNYENQGLAKVVGKSDYVQNFGVAVRKGSSLLPQLNKALAEVQADGTVARLAAKYLNISEGNLLPTPTPAPQPTAAPTPAGTPTPAPCKNGSDYGQPLDLSIPDGTVVQPGGTFTKGWRLVNSGTCEWTAGYSLVYAYGDSRMGGLDTPISGPVAVGASVDAYVPMVAPAAPGIYTAYWQMEDVKGVPFGKRVSVKIQVPVPPTAVPAPTKTPQPGVSYWADSYQLKANQCTYVHWSVQGVKEIYFYQEGQSWQGHPATGKEDRQVCPAQSTTYYLRVVYTNGTDETLPLRINVEAPPPNLPVITRFDSSPQGQVLQGECLNLYWDVQGEVTRLALVRNGSPLIDYGPVSGSYDCDKPDPGSYTYELQAWGPGGGPVKRPLSITVIPKTEPPPVNPATQNCIDQGGQHTTAQRGDGGEYGICMFQDNRQCEEWAMMYGNCPVGGVKVTGYNTSAATYCAITGGQYAATGNEGAPDEQGTCAFGNGVVCDVWAYYNGQCSP